MTNAQTEITNFKSKLDEFATFAETVFQGNNEFYKKELISKVGHFFGKSIVVKPTPSVAKLKISSEKQTKAVKINLPNEIWLRILGFMELRDILLNFALTCKHFNELSLDPWVTRSLMLEDINTKIHHKQVIKLLKRSTIMKAIEISNCQNFNSLISTAFMSSNVLNCVSIRGIYETTKNQISRFSNILKNSGQNLEILSLEGGFQKCLTEGVISKLNNLKELFLHHQASLTSKELIALGKYCKIEYLLTDILCDDQTNVAFETFFKATENTLKELKISHDWSSGICSSKINWTEYLSICKCLEELEIQGSGGPSSLLKGITELSNLRVLYLNDIGWDYELSKNITNLFDNLDLNCIEYFGTYRMNITLENFMILANRQWPSLEVVCFYHCYDLKLDENTLKTLISNSPELEKIHLADTKVDLTDEQVLNFQNQSGVTIGLGYTRDQKLYSNADFCEICRSY